MHQLKEVDMLSAKMDLLMKKLEDRTNEKQEIMHMQDSCITCEECGNTGHSGNSSPKIHEDMNFVNNNYFVLNRIKDGISKGQTTKVTIKVIISIINHP